MSEIQNKRDFKLFQSGFSQIKFNQLIEEEDFVILKTKTSIQHLPNEVLEYIFKFLKDGFEIQKIRRVCKRWKQIIDSSNSLWMNAIFFSPYCKHIVVKNENEARIIYCNYHRSRYREQRNREEETLKTSIREDREDQFLFLALLMDWIIIILLIIQIILIPFYLEKQIPSLLLTLVPTFISFLFIYLLLLFHEWNYIVYGLNRSDYRPLTWKSVCFDTFIHENIPFSLFISTWNKKLGRFFTWLGITSVCTFFILLGFYCDKHWFEVWVLFIPSYIFFVLFYCGSFVSLKKKHALFKIGSCFSIIGSLLISIFLLFTEIKLLNEKFLSWIYIFIPLWILNFFICIFPCVVIFSNLEDSEECSTLFCRFCSLLFLTPCITVFQVLLPLKLDGILDYLNWHIIFIPIYALCILLFCALLTFQKSSSLD